MKTKYYIIVLQALLVWISMFLGMGCKKLVEVDLPIDRLTAKSVFNNTSGATAALSYIYYIFPGVVGDCSITNALTSDELVLHNQSDTQLQPFFSNTLSSNIANNNWGRYYELIFRINSVLEGVESSSFIPESAKGELRGQAKFLRAFVNFYLVNLYGGVPIVTATDYKGNMLLPRNTETEVYEQIIKDLTEAESLVSENYLKPDLISVTNERVTANKAVISAFLARVYLYTYQWQKAEYESTKVIQNPNYTIVGSLDKVFLMNSGEAIWQIEGDVTNGVNSSDANFFIPEFSGTIPRTYLSNNLLKEIPEDDQRRMDWLNSVKIGIQNYYYPFKYKSRTLSGGITTEYNMILRLAEQYLIRSEARAHLNNIDGSIADLNVIRQRAKVPLYNTLSQQALLQAIEKERQVELFSEFGHRWFDLKRTGRLDAVMTPVKGSNWQPTDKLFPIPANEFNLNSSLRGHQNPGYTEN